jgi:flagellar motility protein MotE (MotC chaperone)
MIRYVRDLRLIPIALIASACLLAVKIADLALHGSGLFASDNTPASEDSVAVIHPMPDATAAPGSTQSWATQMFNFPGASAAPPMPSAAPNILPKIADRDSGDITGSVTTQQAGGSAAAPDPNNPAGAGGAQSAGNPPGANGAANGSGGNAAIATAASPGQAAKPTIPAGGGTLIPTEGTAMPTGAERAILERLRERREELDTRARELDIRESLIQGAEKRMDAKLDELKQIENRIKVETQQKNDAEATSMKGLVTMYENMKPRDAAKIFNGLDGNVLIEVAGGINPRQMADILAQMSPDVAQHLTVELADKAQQVKDDGSPSDLPKIEGQPTTP